MHTLPKFSTHTLVFSSQVYQFYPGTSFEPNSPKFLHYEVFRHNIMDYGSMVVHAVNTAGHYIAVPFILAKHWDLLPEQAKQVLYEYQYVSKSMPWSFLLNKTTL